MMGEGIYKKAIEEDRLKEETIFIIEQYKINGNKYQIMYKKETKAHEVFNALNRMIVSGKDKDIQDDIQIIKMFEPVMMSIPIEKNKWWKKS